MYSGRAATFTRFSIPHDVSTDPLATQRFKAILMAVFFISASIVFWVRRGGSARIGSVIKPQDAPELVEGAATPEKHSYGEILKSSALIGFSTLINLAIGIIRTKADGGVAWSGRLRIDGPLQLDCRSRSEHCRYGHQRKRRAPDRRGRRRRRHRTDRARGRRAAANRCAARRARRCLAHRVFATGINVYIRQ